MLLLRSLSSSFANFGFRRRKFAKKVTIGLATAAIFALQFAPIAQATPYYWDSTVTGTWATGAKWSTNSTGSPAGTVVPLATDTAFFNGSGVNGAETVQLAADASIAGITFNNTGTTLIDSSTTTTHKLSIGTGGITVAATAGAVTIGNAANLTTVALTGNQIWTNNSGNTLSVITNAASAFSGAFTLTTAGTGSFTFNDTGGKTMAFAGLTINSGSTVNVTSNNYLTNAMALTVNGTLNIGANGEIVGVLNGSGTVNETGAQAFYASSGTWAGNYTGASAVFQKNTAAQTLTFTGTNDYGGATNVTAGTLALSNVNAVHNSSGIIVANNAQLLINQASVQGPGSPTVFATVPMTITGNGGAFSTGALRFNAPANHSNYTLPGLITLGGAGLDDIVSFNAGNNYINLTGGITGTGSLEIDAGGASFNHYHLFTLSGTLNYSGGQTQFDTNAASGRVLLSGTTLPSATALTLNANTVNGTNVMQFDLGGNSQTVASLVVGAGGGINQVVNSSGIAATLTINNSGPDTFAGNLGSDTQTTTGTLVGAANNFALIKTGAGTLTLSGSNTYTGATQVTVGTLTLSGTGAINSSSGVTVNGSGAQFVQSSTVAGTPGITLTQGTLSGSGTVGAVNVGAGTGGIISNNNGVAGASLTTGALTFNGAATVNLFSDGVSTSALLVAGALSTNAAGTVTINPAAATWTNGSTYDLISYTGGSIGGAGFGQFALGTVSGLNSRQTASSLSNSGTAVTFSISGADTIWTGKQSSEWSLNTIAPLKNWTLSGGGGDTDFHTADSVIFGDSATLKTVDISNGDVAPSVVTFTNTTGNDYTLQGANGVTGATALNKTGNGTLTITNANTYTGATSISAGTLNLTGSLTGTAITVSGAAVLAESSTGSIGGAVSLTKSSSGTSTLAGVNTYTGATSISAGTLNLTGSLAGTAITVSGTAVLAESSTGSIGGSTGLTLSSTGTNILSGANTYTGATNITAGTLQMSGAGTIAASSGVLLSSGATLDLNGTNQTINLGASAGTIANNSGSGTSVLTFNGSANAGSPLIVDSTSNPGGLVAVVVTTSSQTFNTANTYSGGTTVNGGAFLYLGAAGTAAGTGTINLLASNSGLLANGITIANDVTGAGYIGDNVNGAATITLTGTVSTSGIVTFRNAGNIYNFAGSGNSTLSGSIGTLGGTNGLSSAGSIIKSGTGTLTLAGANIYTGTTTISGGSLSLSGVSGTAAASSGYTISGGGILKLDNTSAANNTNRLKDTGGVTMNGGTFNFSNNGGAVNYSETAGALTIAAGSNTVSASQADPGQTSVLTFASLTRTGGNVNFSGTGLGVDTRNQILLTTPPTMVGGVLGAWATYNGTDLAAYDNTLGVIAYTGYTDVQRLTPGIIADGSTTNVRIVEGSGAPGNITLGSTTTTINTLMQSTVGGSSAATIDATGQTLAVNGIVAFSGAGALTIGTSVNSGTLQTATPGGDLTLNNGSARVWTINSTIADNTSASTLTVTGGGIVVLAGTNTYTGNTTVNGGTLNITGAYTGNTTTSTLALGTTAANTVVNVSNDMTLFAVTGANIAGSATAYNQTAGIVNISSTGLGASNVANNGYGYFVTVHGYKSWSSWKWGGAVKL